MVAVAITAIASLLPALPAQAAAAYLLPWRPGDYYECIQGNNSVADHQGIEAYAFDFPMARGRCCWRRAPAR